jgi:hypothetical protein
MLKPIGTTNRHEFLIQAALLWLVHSNTKNQEDLKKNSINFVEKLVH